VAPAAGGAYGPFLYIGGGNGNGALSQYALSDSQPLHSIVEGGNISGLAVDHSGRLIAIHAVSGLSVFDGRNLELLRNSEATYPASVAIDRSDNIYMANCGAAIEVLYPGARKRAGWIGAQYGACIVAVSPHNDVYVVNGYGLIDVYRPQQKAGSVKLLRRIKKGLIDPDALAFSRSGDLYVSNYPLYGGLGTITVYAPNSTSPKRTLIDGINLPRALAIDSHETLYVANDPQTWSRTDGWIAVYGPTGNAPIRRIKKGINAPVAVATDSRDNLYVANIYDDDVTVYASQGSELIRTIRHGVNGPYALAVGN
jgi:sugar lactone lactonase YvrE